MTSFEEIYDVFLSNISDHIFLENDIDDSLKLRYLKNAIPRFSKCRKILKNRTDDGFDENLTDEEVNILGLLMVIEYLNPQITSINNIRQSMGTKDFQFTSQANFLESLLKLKESISRDVRKLILDYTYNTADLENLK